MFHSLDNLPFTTHYPLNYNIISKWKLLFLIFPVCRSQQSDLRHAHQASERQHARMLCFMRGIRYTNVTHLIDAYCASKINIFCIHCNPNINDWIWKNTEKEKRTKMKISKNSYRPINPVSYWHKPEYQNEPKTEKHPFLVRFFRSDFIHNRTSILRKHMYLRKN